MPENNFRWPTYEPKFKIRNDNTGIFVSSYICTGYLLKYSYLKRGVHKYDHS